MELKAILKKSDVIKEIKDIIWTHAIHMLFIPCNHQVLKLSSHVLHPHRFSYQIYCLLYQSSTIQNKHLICQYNVMKYIYPKHPK
jgi:hypothetical protein